MPCSIFLKKQELCCKALVFTILTILPFTSQSTFSQSAKSFDDAEQHITYIINNSLNQTYTIDSLINNKRDLIAGIAGLKKTKILIKDKKLEKAEELIKKTLTHFKNTSSKKGIGYCHYYTGNIASITNQSDSLIKAYTQALAKFSDCNFFDGIIICHFKLATHYSKKGISILAKRHFNEAEYFFINSSNDRLKCSVLLNKAAYYTELNEVENALILYQNIEKNFPNHLTVSKQSRLFNNVAINYAKIEDWKSAKEYYEKSLMIKNDLNDSIGILTTTQNLFNLCVKSRQISEAKNYYSNLSNHFENNNSLDKTYITFLDNEIDYHVLIGSYEILPILVENFITKTELFNNATFSDKLIEMQKSFEIQERDKNIALLEAEDELNEAKLRNQLLIILSIGALALTLLILGYFIMRQRNRLRKSETNLKKQQKEIKHINQELEVSNKAKDKILSIIGHDLRGPIGGLKELIELYMELPEYDPKDFTNLLKAAREASTSTYHLLENLLSWANSQRGHIQFKPVATPLLPLIKQSINVLDSSINTRNVQFRYDIASNLVLTADLNMLRTIMRNLVSNAVKYSPPESFITISAKSDSKETIICIADEGYGMSAEESTALFEKRETFFIESGYNAKGTGLGLILCKDFVDLHKGRIWASSKKNVGTKVCFAIPHKIFEGSNQTILQTETNSIS